MNGAGPDTDKSVCGLTIAHRKTKKENIMAFYKWKSKSMHCASAQVAGEMCEELAKGIGLTPKNLLDANREEGTALHDEFEWDDSKAAESYRIEQASHIIRSIVIVNDREDNPASTVTAVFNENDKEESKDIVRAFFRVTEDVGRYTPVSEVMKNEDMYDVLIRECRRDMNAFINKYNVIEGLHDVIDSMKLYMSA